MRHSGRLTLPGILVCCALLTSCQDETPPLAYVAPLDPGSRTSPIADTLIPTANLATWTATASPTFTPTATASVTPGITPTPISTPLAREASAATWTPPPRPPAQLNDHYQLSRPIAAGATNWVDRTYPYGSTSGGRLPLHHGVEFVNAHDTEVLAAASGTVHFAGNDSETQFGSSLNHYGNLVVLRHASGAPRGKTLYTLYAHLGAVMVASGERVAAGDVLGLVGDSGIADGPHLHLEVRVEDPSSYGATRNPELWLAPFRGYGTLAGRVIDSAGNLLREATISVRSTDLQRYIWSYADDAVNGDDEFGENYVLGDLPANYYEVTVGENGRIRFRRTIYIWPGRSNWLIIQLED